MGTVALTAADVDRAWAAIREHVRHTPLKRSSTLTSLTGSDFHLKLENFQLTGSFKVRGALNRVRHLSEGERRAGVVAASAGNHAQGVAFAASRAGVRSTIFMPEDATLAKVKATKAYGAEVRLVGKDYQEAYEQAIEHQRKSGAVYVHAFDDPLVMAGQGTLGLEILQDLPNVDNLLVPVGGGGLISGIATAVKARRPSCRIIGVQADGASTVAPSLNKGAPVSLERADTMADGIAVRNVGKSTFPIMQSVVDEVVTVSESEIAAAILFLLERVKAVAEGAGAVGLAAAMHGKVKLKGTTCALVSGGNVDMMLVSRIIRLGMVKEGRIAVLVANISDRPGSLAAFLALIASRKASVIEVRHDRDRTDVPINRTGVEVHVETRGPEHVQELEAALQAAGYPVRVQTALA